jgi:aldose 1-epimerase
VRFRLVSPDGDQGLPGRAEITLTYRLSTDGALAIHYRAVAERDTVFNLTNHSYFNLTSYAAGTIADHWLSIDAAAYTPTDAESIPTGEIRPVAGTPFDFTQAKPIGQDIDAADDQLLFAGGYDHNFVLRAPRSLERAAACVWSPVSGIRMDVYTDMPGVQFYTGNKLGGPHEIPLKAGVVAARRGGFCLETQYFPDAPHHRGFPSPIFRGGEVFESTTVYRFSLIE